MGFRRWLCLVGLAVVGAGAEPRVPAGVGLELPLCWQVELPPGLLAALSAVTVNPSPLPAPVRLATPAAAGLPGVVEVAGAGPLGVGPGAVTLGSAGPVALPGAVGLPAESPPAVPATVGEAGLVLAAARAGDRSTATLAKLAELPTATLVAALAAGDDWRAEEQPYLDALASVLLSRPEVAPLAESLPRRARRFLADSLSRRGDGRCVAIYEGLLQAYEAQPAAGWVPEVGGLAGYYMVVLDFQQAATVWSRGMDLTSAAYVQCDFQAERARCHLALGQTREGINDFTAARDAAHHCGQAWIAVMAAVHLAGEMSRSGQGEAALAILDEELGLTCGQAGRWALRWAQGVLLKAAGREHEAAETWQVVLKEAQVLKPDELAPGARSYLLACQDLLARPRRLLEISNGARSDASATPTAQQAKATEIEVFLDTVVPGSTLERLVDLRRLPEAPTGLVVTVEADWLSAEVIETGQLRVTATPLAKSADGAVLSGWIRLRSADEPGRVVTDIRVWARCGQRKLSSGGNG